LTHSIPLCGTLPAWSVDLSHTHATARAPAAARLTTDLQTEQRCVAGRPQYAQRWVTA